MLLNPELYKKITSEASYLHREYSQKVEKSMIFAPRAYSTGTSKIAFREVSSLFYFLIPNATKTESKRNLEAFNTQKLLSNSYLVLETSSY